MGRFVEWIPVFREHRPYDTLPNVQPVGGCHRCERCFPNGDLIEYPQINYPRPPRRVCGACLEKDKQDGTFDAIMDIWDNYEDSLSMEEE